MRVVGAAEEAPEGVGTARSDMLPDLGGIRSWAAFVPESGTITAQIDGWDGSRQIANPIAPDARRGVSRPSEPLRPTVPSPTAIMTHAT